jgi:single-strand DNA-binding protein
MANLNKVFLIGNLTRAVELKYTPAGTAVGSFGLATNRNFTAQSGEKKQETCFVRVVVWGKQAETCNQYLAKGSSVFVEGRLIYRTWDSKDGQKKSTLEVRADRVQFLGKPMRDAAAQAEVPAPDAAALPDDDFSGLDAKTDDFAAQDERDLT